MLYLYLEIFTAWSSCLYGRSQSSFGQFNQSVRARGIGPDVAPSTARRLASVVVEVRDKLSAKITPGEVTLGRCSTSTIQSSMTAMRWMALMRMDADMSFFKCLFTQPYTRLMLSTCSLTALFRSLPGMVTKGSRRPPPHQRQRSVLLTAAAAVSGCFLWSGPWPLPIPLSLPWPEQAFEEL